MGVFSTTMRGVATDLIKQFGNKAVLEQRVKGAYDPMTGETAETVTTINTFSALIGNASRAFGDLGQNTNLAGFSDDTIMVAYSPALAKVDETWTIDGQNIVSVSKIISQDDIIAYTIEVRKG